LKGLLIAWVIFRATIPSTVRPTSDPASLNVWIACISLDCIHPDRGVRVVGIAILACAPVISVMALVRCYSGTSLPVKY